MADSSPITDRDILLERVLADYLHAVASGTKPDRAELLRKYPDLASDLVSFFRNRDAVERIAAPVRQQSALPETSDGTASSPADFAVGAALRYFGDYEVLAEIARGGMGVVYKARQVSLNRTVAIKMILRGELATQADVQRFRAEAEAAGHLDHPNIVPIYEVGEHAGEHYFSMKMIDGGSLSQKIPELVQNPREAARLLATTARAIHHAHQHGVLHRDLKPANILLDTKGEPHVTDFGLAKRVEGDSQLTQSGAIVGTPSYMPPEQATGRKGLTTAADTYSLGAILYELLTGRPPFRGETPLDTLLQVTEREPALPQTINPTADRELETIAMKCLEKDPIRRYGSVAALADDLERWLTGRPILARPTTAIERAVKWAKRQPVLAAAVGVVAFAAVGLVILAGVLWRNAELRAEAVQNLGLARAELVAVEAEKKQAENDRVEANSLAEDLRKLADKIDAEVKRLRAQADAARKDLETARAAAARTLYAADMQLAHAAWQADNGAGTLELLQRYEKPGTDDPRGFEWNYLWRLTHGSRLTWNVASPVVPFNAILGTATSPDGKTVATADSLGKIKLWNLSDGSLRKTLDIGKGTLVSLTFADEGRKLVAGMKKELDGQAMVKFIVGPGTRKDQFDIAALREQLTTHTWTLADEKRPVVAPFDPANPPGVMAAFMVGGLFVQHEGDAMNAVCIAGSPDGKFLALVGMAIDVPGLIASGKTVGKISGGKLIVWDVAKARVHAVQNAPGMILAVTFSKDGKKLAVGNADGAVGIGEPDLKNPPRLYIGHRGFIFSLAFTADGSTLVSGGMDGHVIAWDVAAGKELTRYRGHSMSVARVVLTPDGNTIVSCGADGSVMVWDRERTANPMIHRGHATVVPGLAFSANGQELVSVDRDRVVRTWGVDRKLLKETKGGAELALSVAIAPNGGKVAWNGNIKDEGTVIVRNVSNGADTRVTWKGKDHVPFALGFAGDGGMIAMGNLMAKGGLAVMNTTDGKQLAALDSVEGMAHVVTFSPDSKLVAAGHKGGVILWDWKANTSRRVMDTDNVMTTAVAFSVDGKLLVAATGNATRTGTATVRIWDMVKNEVRVELAGAGQAVTHVAFSPDGRRLATVGVTSSQQGLLKLWDLSGGREVFSASLPPAMVTALTFSPDGKRLAAATQAADVTAALTGRKVPGDVYLWDATSVE